MMTKTLIRGLILGALALAVSGCYYGPPPSYGYYGGYPAYSYPSYGYYYGPSVSFGYYGGGGWHHDHDWH
ncbi:MAG: hypothetical protein KGI46_11550 [Alphaproteobacteria bacterium]|nr:hypothetical protein [Alphaproteobacteria bacterium]MDE1931519.1 hypothetical protein [Alphaproteobacteria bacterium]